MLKLNLIISIFFIFHYMANAQEHIRVESMEFSDPSNYSYLYQVPYVSTSSGLQNEVTERINKEVQRTLVLDYLIPVQDNFSLGNDGAMSSNRWYKQIYDYEFKEGILRINYEFTIRQRLIKGILRFDIKDGSLIKECTELRAWK